jgi:membrane protease YdiL (CAAX protease family)
MSASESSARAQLIAQIASSLALAFALVLALGFLLGWLRLKSGSVRPAAVLHASHNLFVQRVLDAMAASEGIATYFTTEFDIGLALAPWGAVY